MVKVNLVDKQKINDWVSKSMTPNEVAKDLSSQGYNDDQISLFLEALKKAKIKKRQSLGFLFLAIGAFLGFISCVFAIINPDPELLDVFLYGLTPLSVIIVFIGLYMVFE